MYEVIGYQTESGEIPIQAFLQTLPIRLREKTLRSMLLLQEWGPRLRGEETRHLRDGIFELRSSFGGDTVRILYFFMAGKRVVVTNGFMKKTRKTPVRELERAMRYKRDWEERHG